MQTHLQSPEKSSRYRSTRGGIAPVGFTDAVMMGLADDGGLLLPEALPQVDAATLDAWRGLSYPDLACAVMAPFIGDAIPADDLKALVAASYATFDLANMIAFGKFNSAPRASTSRSSSTARPSPSRTSRCSSSATSSRGC